MQIDYEIKLPTNEKPKTQFQERLERGLNFENEIAQYLEQIVDSPEYVEKYNKNTSNTYHQVINGKVHKMPDFYGFDKKDNSVIYFIDMKCKNGAISKKFNKNMANLTLKEIQNYMNVCKEKSVKLKIVFGCLKDRHVYVFDHETLQKPDDVVEYNNKYGNDTVCLYDFERAYAWDVGDKLNWDNFTASR